MIIKFYIFWLFIIITIFSMAYLKKSKETYLRVITYFVIVTIISIAYIIGIYGFFILVTLILVLGVYEVCKNYRYGHPVLLFSTILASYMLILYFKCCLPYGAGIFLIVAIYTFVGKKEFISNKVYLYLFGVFILAISAASLVCLYDFNPEFFLLLILLLVFNDVTGYFVGKKFGKVRIFKKLSPEKSLEGYIGSMFGILVGITVAHTIVPILLGTSLFQSFILLMFFFVVGNGGDLLFSRIKRCLNIKDYSSLLPGHGGVLDRFDNILSVAPLFLMLISYFIK